MRWRDGGLARGRRGSVEEGTEAQQEVKDAAAQRGLGDLCDSALLFCCCATMACFSLS